jgi:hypothetical protein
MDFAKGVCQLCCSGWQCRRKGPRKAPRTGRKRDMKVTLL